MEVKLIEYVDNAFNMSEGKGFHEKWTLKQKLVLIITELAESIEAHRKNNFCGEKLRLYFDDRIKQIGKFSNSSFETNIKDTVEDELADTFIRICDLLGLLFNKWEAYTRVISTIELKAKTGESLLQPFNSFQDNIFDIMHTVIRISEQTDPTRMEKFFGLLLGQIFQLAEKEHIPLKKHVDWKMQYNSTRPAMHNKEY